MHTLPGMVARIRAHPLRMPSVAQRRTRTATERKQVMKRTLPSIKAGVREKVRARNGDGAIHKLINAAFCVWHMKTVGTPYCQWTPRKNN